MSDDLTARIAEVLVAHRNAGSAGGLLVVCGCGEAHDDFYAHQAEQVRAALGETTTEWESRNEAGGGAIFDSHAEAEEEMARWDAHASYPVDEPPWPPSVGIFRREVTPWTEVTS